MHGDMNVKYILKFLNYLLIHIDKVIKGGGGGVAGCFHSYKAIHRLKELINR